MNCNFVSLQVSAVLEISMPRTEVHDVYIFRLRFNLLVIPTVSKKLQTNVMLSYKLFKLNVFLNSANFRSKYKYFFHFCLTDNQEYQ